MREIMKRLIGLIVLVESLSLPWATSALALSVDFVPGSQTVPVGRPVSVDTVLSGLAAAGPPSVGAFDLDVSFDPSILSPTGVTFGAFLGDPSLFEALTASSFLPGVVDLAEVSLLAPTDLDTLQPVSFALATLSFDTLAFGNSSLNFSQVIVSDAFGERLDPLA